MKTFVCEKCGYKTEKGDRAHFVICPCGGVCQMLENLPRGGRDEIRLHKKKESPEIIFRDGGVGWVGKDGKRHD